MPYTLNCAPAALMMLAAFTLGACAKGGVVSDVGAAAAAAVKTDPAEYVSYSDQFAGLQTAGLRGRYSEFAGHLKAPDPASVTNTLQRFFQGRPFDVYTLSATTGPQTHQRLVELRSTSGRLYLYVELDKVPGGWNVAEYKLDNKKTTFGTQL
ncbi:MAG: hypothetical protein AB8B85_20965 [Paracoccaceae bacterium]